MVLSQTSLDRSNNMLLPQRMACRLAITVFLQSLTLFNVMTCRPQGRTLLPHLCSLVGHDCGVCHWHYHHVCRRPLHRNVPHGGRICGFVRVDFPRLFPLPLKLFSGSALTMSWVSNVVSRPPAKRSAAIAIVNGNGCLSFVYVQH